MKKAFLTFLLTFSLVITACGGTTTPTESPEEGTDTSTEDLQNLGLVFPLTGDVASIGQDLKLTVEMFLEENPEWAGQPVEVVYEDGQCNGQHAASAAQKLINVDQVPIIIGGGCSGETLGIAPLTEKAEVLLYTPLSTSPEISGIGKYTFRGAPSDELSSVMMTDLLKDQYTKVALITQNNDYSQAYRQALQEKLPAAGVEIVVDESFNAGTTDFKSILQKVKDSEAEALLNIPGEISPGGFIAKQAMEMGIELPMYGGDVLSGDEFFEIAKDASEGTTIVITAADRTRPDVASFLSRFEEKKGAPSAAEAYVLLMWDEMNVLKQAVEATGGFDTDALVEYLENMEPYEGLGGVTDFDNNHDGNIQPSVMVAEDGKFVIKK